MATPWPKQAAGNLKEQDLLDQVFFIHSYKPDVDSPFKEGEKVTEVEISLEEDGEHKVWRTGSHVVKDQLEEVFGDLDADIELPFEATLKKVTSESGMKYSSIQAPGEAVPF